MYNYNEYIVISLIILILMLFFIYFIVFLICYQKFKKDDIYLGLINLNQMYYFNKIRSKIRLYDDINTLRQLRKIEPNVIIYNGINSNRSGLRDELDKIHLNRINFVAYNKEFNEIIKQIDIKKYRIKILNKNEKYMKLFICNNKRLKPKIDFIVIYNASYTSPAGRNHVEKNVKYNYDDLIRICSYYDDEKKKQELRRKFIENERAKMSDSLRYNVLKRDNFKCSLCGATIADGVKLHVDHIVPVSKGGKTEISNLQTLCERCNIGKSNKL